MPLRMGICIMTDDLIGKRIGGYDIIERVGQGGMAVVYRAHQVSMNRTVALKVLPRHFMNDTAYLQRFHREVRIVAQLEHRNIVPVYDYGEQDGQPYIVMRYMSGGSVDDRLSEGALDLQTIVHIVEQIAPALDYAHSKEVLHRDLKPSNILMDDGGGAYITDFGIARILGEQGSTITTHGVVGTPSYMSPEQAQAQPMDGRSDLYSLGIMLFEMATGRRPFESDTPYSIAVMQVTATPPNPRSLNPNLSPEVEQVILKTIHKRREDRYPTAVALAEALKRAAELQEGAMHDTQPGMTRPPLPPPPVAPVVSPPTPPRTPPVGSASQSVAPGLSAPRSRGSLLLSGALGMLIGCGLLTLVVVIGYLVVNNTAQEERALMLTATAAATAETTAAVSPTTQRAASAATDRPPMIAATERALTTLPSPGVTLDAETIRQTVNAITPVTRTAPTLDPSPAALSGKLVYFSERGGDFNIFSMDLASREETQLTQNALSDLYPSPSPDGRQIAFQSDRDGDFDIYVMEATGINTRRLTVTRYDDRTPAWSPDGAWIAFVSDVRGDGNYDLFRIRPDGTDLELLYNNGLRSSQPRWSSDSRYLLFTNGKWDDAKTWEILRYDTETRLTVFLTDNTSKDWGASFSSDGERILYLTDGEGYAAIARMDIDGGDRRLIYDSEGYESSAAYSPDGSMIVFTSDVSGRDELYVVGADGSSVERLTNAGAMGASWTE